MPLMLMTGGMGEYISLIPKVAILALVASLVECFVVLPIHLYHRRPDLTTTDTTSWRVSLRDGMEKSATVFSEWSRVLVRRPLWSMSGFIVLFLATSLVAYVKMDFKLFEATETRSVKFNIDLEQSATLSSSKQLLAYALDNLGEQEEHFSDIVLINGFKNHNYQRTLREKRCQY